MQTIQFFSLEFVFKVFILILLLIYNIFAIVVVKQVTIMNRTLDVGMENVIKILSYLHLVFAVLVFLTAWIIL